MPLHGSRRIRHKTAGMRTSIPAIYNGDSYIFHLGDDGSIVLIERFAGNQNVIPEQLKFDDFDPELQARFHTELKRRQNRGR
jgi:hypothetical protein